MKLNSVVDQAYLTARANGFHDKKREFGTIISLIHSELSECLEAHREGNWPGVKEEFADVIIRVADTCGAYNIDLESEVTKKMRYNKQRPHLHGKNY